MVLACVLGAVLGVLVLAAVTVMYYAKRFEPMARQWLVAAIQKRYESGVEIGAFHAKLYPIPESHSRRHRRSVSTSGPISRLSRKSRK